MSDVGYSGVANLAPTTLGYSRDVQGSNYQQLQGVGDGGVAMLPSYVSEALTILQRFGTDAHVYQAGANGVAINSLLSNNYILSDGSTGYSAVDGPVGLVLDGAGSVGSELFPQPNFDASTGLSVGAGWSISGGLATLSAGAGVLTDATNYLAYTTGNTYRVEIVIDSHPSGGTFQVYLRGAVVATSGLTTPGTYSWIVQAGSSTTEGLSILGVASCVGSITSASVKQVTGIHATQATTANKPTVRRGLLNLLLNSKNLLTGWAANNGAAITGANTGTLSTPLNSTIYEYVATTVANQAYTAAMLISGTPGAQMKLRIEEAGGAFGGTDTVITLSATPTLYAATFTSTLTSLGVMARSTGAACSVTIDAAGLFTGTLTAQQILDSGGIPLTTSAAASNTSAGRYSLEFDKTDSIAMSAPAFQMADDSCTIAAMMCPAATPSDAYFVNPASGAANQLVSSLAFQTGTGKIQAAWVTDAAAQVIAILDSTNRLGQRVVATAVKRGAAKQLRVNGAQAGSTDNTAIITPTTVSAGVIGGFNVANTSLQAFGTVSIVIAIKGTLSDAEMLALERFAASTLPNAPSF